LKNFIDILIESGNQQLDEALITFGGKANPRFGQIVILAGGAGSGKGFVLSNLVGVQGKVFDVDALKALAIESKKFASRVKRETGKDLKSFDLRKPENVSAIHGIIGVDYKLDSKVKSAAFKSIALADPQRKPNLIFDVTLKDIKKLKDIARDAENLGYEKENIHLVWVVNDIEIAKKQNASRSRVVPSDILLDTHKGASSTMKDILSMGDKLKQYMNGEIVLAFNRFVLPNDGKNDAEIATSGKGGSYIKKANYVYVKRKGKTVLSPSEISSSVIDKIKSYVPKDSFLS